LAHKNIKDTKHCKSQKRHLMLHTGKNVKQLSQYTPQCKSISESTILTWFDLTYTIPAIVVMPCDGVTL